MRRTQNTEYRIQKALLSALGYVAALATIAAGGGCRGQGKQGVQGGPGEKSTPRRVVSMVPSATEILFSIGAGAAVVGVCDQCLFPGEAAKRPRLGSYLNPSTERILALKPDAVFLYETQGALIGILEGRGIRGVPVRTEDLEDVYGAVAEIAGVMGEEKTGGLLVEAMKARLGLVAKKAGGEGGKKVKTAVVVDRMPGSLQRLFVAAGPSYVGQLLAIAGGDNCFGQMGQRYPMVSLEAIAGCGAEVIIDVRPRGECSASGIEAAVKMWRESGIFAEGGSVKKVRVIPADPLTIPGPRAVDAADILWEALHGQ